MNYCLTCGSTIPAPEPDSRLHLALTRIDLLSPRELDVFLLLRDGLSNREISRVLHISERTAKAHVASLLEKLVLESRLQLAMAALIHTASPPCLPGHVPMANRHRHGGPVGIDMAG